MRIKRKNFKTICRKLLNNKKLKLSKPNKIIKKNLLNYKSNIKQI